MDPSDEGVSEPGCPYGIGRVECRPGPFHWCLLLLPLLLLVFTAAAASGGVPGRTEWAALALMGGCGLVGGALYLFWLCRWRIIADEAGLRWRTYREWHEVSWSEVRDYYDRLPSDPRTKVTSMFIETSAGTIIASAFLRGRDELRAIVTERARWARTTEWGTLGKRAAGDLPRSFRYDVGEARFMLCLTCLLVGGWIIWFPYVLGTRLPAALEIGTGYAAALFLLGGLATGSMPLLYLTITLPAARERLSRREEQVTLTEAEISLRTASGSFVIPWSEVTGCVVQPVRRWASSFSRYQIHSRRGRIEFSGQIRDVRILLDLIRKNLPDGTPWEEPETELLTEQHQEWSLGAPGMGRRIFQYRLRTYRAMGWLASAYLLAPFLVAGIGRAGLLPPDRIPSPWLQGFCVFGLAVFWTAYSRCRVEAGADGIRVVGLWRSTDLHWNDLRSVECRRMADLRIVTLRTDRRVARFWLGISRSDELLDEIRRRAVNARVEGLPTSLTSGAAAPAPR